MRKVLTVLALVVVPGLAMAATPSEGVALQVRRGFFTETDVGVFGTLGGKNNYSNAQTYLQIGAGYDIGQLFSLGAHFGIGSNAANCWQENEKGECMADNFTMTFLDLTGALHIPLTESRRFFFTPKLALGYTLLDPAPTESADGAKITSAPNMGAGVGFEYATSMDHFSVGLDVLGRYVVGPNILTYSVFPRVKYTF